MGRVPFDCRLSLAVRSCKVKVWLERLRRRMILSGELKMMIEQGLRGVPSNPTIFDKAQR